MKHAHLSGNMIRRILTDPRSKHVNPTHILTSYSCTILCNTIVQYKPYFHHGISSTNFPTEVMQTAELLLSKLAQ